MAKNLDAMGIHIYAGGFTIGVMKHFSVLAQWEEMTFGTETFELNRAHFPKDIDRPTSIDDWRIPKYKGIPFIYANPPCAPWSSANSKPGHVKANRVFDDRLKYTHNTMTVGRSLTPDVFICESVENAYNFGLDYYHTHVRKWMEKGYSVTLLLTDGVLHGLPSTRRRFHFIAHRYELQLQDPDMRDFSPLTVRDTIWDLRDRMGEVSLHHTGQRRGCGIASPPSFWRKVPVGMGLRRVEIQHGIKSRTGGNSSVFARRLAWDAPASTLISLAHLIHPDGRRLLTWRESLRLLGFPDWFITRRDKEAVDTVTPTMGEYLAGIARKTIQKAKKVRDPKYDVVDWRPYGVQFQVGTMRKSNPKLK